jgi:hypothetical protein
MCIVKSTACSGNGKKRGQEPQIRWLVLIPRSQKKHCTNQTSNVSVSGSRPITLSPVRLLPEGQSTTRKKHVSQGTFQEEDGGRSGMKKTDIKKRTRIFPRKVRYESCRPRQLERKHGVKRRARSALMLSVETPCKSPVVERKNEVGLGRVKVDPSRY